MGGGASSQASFEQMLACTMILGEAMVQGLDPRFVRFPDMYRLMDFHVGPKKLQPKPFQGGSMVIFVHSPDDSGKFQQISNGGDANAAAGDADDKLPAESTADLLVAYVGNDKVVLDKATLNQPNFDGWTPLHACCHSVNTQDAGIAILKELVAQKADLNIVTKRGPGSFSCGWTPLHIACAYGLEALALKLVRAGADVNVANSVKWTPLYESCHRGYSSIARELLKGGAKASVICPEFALCPFPGQCALAEAARQGHEGTVKVLLEWGVDKNAVNKLGWTALHEAAYHSRVSIVKMLVVYGADVFAKTTKGSLAKDVTIHSEIRAMLEDICQHGPASSPKKEKAAAAADSGEGEVASSSSSPKKGSPSKSQSARTAPLSRKEEYALLGDLPSLGGKTMPAISIQDAEDSVDQDGGDDAKKVDIGDDEEAKGERSDGSPKHKQSSKKKHRKKGGSPQDAPQEFKCAVSLKVLKDPLRSPYGQVFERQVIEAWFRDFGNRCPLTGEPLTLQQLTSDEKLKAQIREWKHGAHPKQDNLEPSASSMERKDVSEQQQQQFEAKAAITSAPGANVDPYDF